MSSASHLKNKARAMARAARASLSSPDVGTSLIDHFPAHFTQKRIAGFSPIQDEINIWPLLHKLNHLGRTIALPVTTGPNSPLSFRRWTPGCEMQADQYGVMTPIGTRQIKPELILVPLLAFTGSGARLGYGGGYYDRTLTALRAQSEVFACGVAYAGQEVASLPTDEHDEHLDGILTEDGFRSFK